MLYHLSDFQNMLFNKISYPVDNSVYDILKYIESSLDITELNTSSQYPTVVKEPNKNFNKPNIHHSASSNGQSSYSKKSQNETNREDKNNGRKKNYRENKDAHNGGGGGVGGNNRSQHSSSKNKEIGDGEWEAIRNFKTTRIVIASNGIDKRWTDIRTVLNKISETTYQRIAEKAYAFIEEYLQSEDNTDSNTELLGKNILSLCCSNKFFSELYSSFFVDLCSKYEIFRTSVLPFVEETFTQTIPDYVDADVDYDEYCKYVKVVDLRKSKNTFIVNLMKKGIISEEQVLDIVKWYLDTIMLNVIKDNRSGEVGELSDNLFILVANNAVSFSKYEKWNAEIYPAIESLGKSSNKTFPSISNRIVFKFMDILDTL